MKRLAICILVLLGGSTLLAQNTNSCKQDLLQYVEQMGKLQEPEGNAVYHLQYEVNTTLRKERSNAPTHEEVEVYLCASGMEFRSNSVVVVQDAEDAFMVMHPQRSIVWTNGGQRPNAAGAQAAMLDGQRAFIESARVRACKEVTRKGETATLLMLSPAPNTPEAAQLTSVSYYLNANGALKEMVINYGPQSPIQTQSITYHQLELNHRGWKFKGAKEQVLASTGKPVAKYKGYTLQNLKR